MDLLDIIFPKYCINCRKIGDFFCAKCFTFLSFDVDKICAVCNLPSFNGSTHSKCKGKFTIDGVFSSIAYRGVAKKLIIKFKYDPYLSGLKKVMSDLFCEGLIQKEEFHKVLKPDAALVPVPLYHSRERKRGYNHSEILAKELSQRLNLPMINALKRIKKYQATGKSQAGRKIKKS